MENRNRRFSKRVLKKLGKIGLSLLTTAFILNPSPVAGSTGADLAKDVIENEGAKETLNEALKVARSKPALSIAAGITCIACIPAAGAAASPALCVACGILIAKTLG